MPPTSTRPFAETTCAPKSCPEWRISIRRPDPPWPPWPTARRPWRRGSTTRQSARWMRPPSRSHAGARGVTRPGFALLPEICSATIRSCAKRCSRRRFGDWRDAPRGSPGATSPPWKRSSSTVMKAPRSICRDPSAPAARAGVSASSMRPAGRGPGEPEMPDSNVETTPRPYARIETLLTPEQISRRVAEMGQVLSRDYADKRPLLIAVLKGGFMFLADLVRAMDIDLEVDFLSLSSYGNATVSSGKVHLVHDLRAKLQGRHVILVEGVVDTGHSVRFLLDLLAQREPASLKVCALLDKVPCRREPVPVDYVGFPIGDEFVIGYGMDAAEGLRQLPYVGVCIPNAPSTES